LKDKAYTSPFNAPPFATLFAAGVFFVFWFGSACDRKAAFKTPRAKLLAFLAI
jgi:hypothetical protein